MGTVIFMLKKRKEGRRGGEGRGREGRGKEGGERENLRDQAGK